MSEELHHPCFVALTRPPMLFGVTINFLLINTLTNLALFFVLKRIGVPFWAFLILAGVGHMAGMIACRSDGRFFEVALGKLAFNGYKNKAIWRCHSYEPY
jgi:type IV secretory pathway VirB3-like protein